MANFDSFNLNQHFNMFFGVNSVIISGRRMLKLNTYQKSLLDFFYSQFEESYLENLNENKLKQIFNHLTNGNKEPSIKNNKNDQKVIAKHSDNYTVPNIYSKNLDIQIIHANLLDQEVDAIVCAANNNLKLGG